MISEQQFLSKRVSMLPRKGAEKEHTWSVLESDLPTDWIKAKPRQLVRTYQHPKTGITWTFVLKWHKSRPIPVLRVYR